MRRARHVSTSPSFTFAAIVTGVWVFAVIRTLDAVGMAWWAGALLAGLMALPVVALLHRARRRS